MELKMKKSVRLLAVTVSIIISVIIFTNFVWIKYNSLYMILSIFSFIFVFYKERSFFNMLIISILFSMLIFLCISIYGAYKNNYDDDWWGLYVRSFGIDIMYAYFVILIFHTIFSAICFSCVQFSTWLISKIRVNDA